MSVEFTTTKGRTIRMGAAQTWTDARLAELLRERQAGATIPDLAHKYGVSTSCVQRYLRIARYRVGVAQ